MHMDIEKILDWIPDYKSFFTVDELNERALQLAETYPDVISTKVIGMSEKGYPIRAMIAGKGKQNALCFACPHPNEPIGAMMLITLGELFAKHPEILAETDFTWYLIPCVDPDGTKLNEGWFKGPFNLLNYAKHFYRPPGNKQVEWTFPINIQGLKFNTPLMETKALMKLIDELHPSFMFSLHNSPFGGAYWYSTNGEPEFCANLENAAKRQSIPLHLGEPEAAYITKYSPAVHSMLSITAMVDYMMKYNGGASEITLNCGGCSADYVSTICPCLTLLAEVPYFFDARISDTSECQCMTRREAVLENIRLNIENYTILVKYWSKLHRYFSDDNPYFEFVDSCIESHLSTNQTKENWANGPEFERLATVSEVFDNLYGMRVFEYLNVGLAIRACQFELDRSHELEKDAIEFLSICKDRFSNELERMCKWFEENVDYEVIPIRRLVSVQLESALVAVEHLKKRFEHEEEWNQ